METNNTENTSIIPKLDSEAFDIINQIIEEKDNQKAQDLTQLFNANQTKKTLVRINKLNTLLDTLADQALDRFTDRPDEISNKELLDGLKTVQDLLEKGNKQVTGSQETPSTLIQINQQTNELNVDSNIMNSKESRDKIKNAVANILAGLNKVSTEESDNIVIENGEIKND